MDKKEIIEYQIIYNLTLDYVNRGEEEFLEKRAIEDIFQWIFQGNFFPLKDIYIDAVIKSLTQYKFLKKQENIKLLSKLNGLSTNDIYYDREGLVRIKNKIIQ